MILNKKDALSILTVGAAGVFAGFINGFLGAGGGIILLWILSKADNQKTPRSVRDNFASVVAIVLLLSIVSAVTYSHTGKVDTSRLFTLALPGMIGGVIGAYLTDRLDTSLLKLAFSAIIIVAGINMIF